MSENVSNDVGKLIVDVLIANERLQFALKCNKPDISDAIYILYSSTLKLISNVVNPESRPCRMFRLKYHHILSNESVEEYLYHCLSKILSEVLDEENSYQRFIQPVAELHMKLMSIINQVNQQHYDIVCKNNKVQQEIDKNNNSMKNISRSDCNQSNVNKETRFIPVYFVPTPKTSSKLKKSQFLTFQAINRYYMDNGVDPTMFDMLLDFDNSFAEFELEFVCQVNKGSIISKESAEMTMDVAIMFSDAVSWAHGKGLLRYSSIADCDIEIMVGIPRLSVLYGCGVAKCGPLSEWSLLSCHNKDKVQQRLAPVFQNHSKELARLRRQLKVLNDLEMAYLSRLLLDHSDLPANVLTANTISTLKVDGPANLVSGDVHALFKLISSVSDRMQSEHASDYRFFMETIYRLYKDTDDDTFLQNSSPVCFVKCRSTTDFSCQSDHLSAIIDVDEAVDALSFSSIFARQYLHAKDQCKSLWDIKSYSSTSPSSVNRFEPIKQPNSSNIQIPHIIDCNVKFNRPEWQQDSSCTKCCHCGISFNLFRRRHHCRRCGYLFCNSCWGTKITLPSLGIHSQVPVCVECQEFIEGRRPRSAVSATTQ